jgi:hypothetical protein
MQFQGVCLLGNPLLAGRDGLMVLNGAKKWDFNGISMGLSWYFSYYIWLVVFIILKNISQREGLSHILWKIKNV